MKETLSIECSRRSIRSGKYTGRSSVSTRSATRSVLPSYQQEGIKDIMEYQHAGKYRDVAVTEKCTRSQVQSRLKTFGEVHEFDFRKRPGFLR